MVTPMFEHRVRPRYPLDDSWLFADPMNLALQGEPSVRDGTRRGKSSETIAYEEKDRGEPLDIFVGGASRPELARGKSTCIRPWMCVIVACAGATWLVLGTDIRWQRSDVTSAAASIAAVNCAQHSSSSDALRTL